MSRQNTGYDHAHCRLIKQSFKHVHLNMLNETMGARAKETLKAFNTESSNTAEFKYVYVGLKNKYTETFQ